MENELVSVIIACYNAESYIDECLESIVNQSYQNIEIIICDDASTDDSYSMLKKWQVKDPRILLLRNNQNVHSSGSRNSCIDIAKGKFIMIQDIDDISEFNRVSVLLNTIVNNKVDFVSSSMATIDDSGNIDYDKVFKHKKAPSKYDFLWGISFNHPATLFSKEILNKVNGYRVAEETRGCEDYDMFMRMYANGARGINISDTLYLYRIVNANSKMLKLKNRINECKVRYKGFKQLNILFIGFPMVFMPLMVLVIKRLSVSILARKVFKRELLITN
jgi:glycosyltransferase EpsE